MFCADNGNVNSNHSLPRLFYDDVILRAIWMKEVREFRDDLEP